MKLDDRLYPQLLGNTTKCRTFRWGGPDKPLYGYSILDAPGSSS